MDIILKKAQNLIFENVLFTIIYLHCNNRPNRSSIKEEYLLVVTFLMKPGLLRLSRPRKALKKGPREATETAERFLPRNRNIDQKCFTLS